MLQIGVGIVFALGVTVLAQGYEVKNDKRVEASAAARAASRIGEIRGSIDHDDVAVFVIPEALQTQETKEVDLSPRPAWQPPQTDKEVLPPVVEDEFGPDRDISTGSVNRPKANTTWELFDSNGNRVKRFGFW